MVEYEDQALIVVFKALGDPGRLRIVTLLGQQGVTRVTDLAAQFDMSLNAVSKHIKVLEKADIVKRQVTGREHLIALKPTFHLIIQDWLKRSQNLWQQRLDQLEQIFDQTKHSEGSSS